MVNDQQIKRQFDEARQELIKQLFSPEETAKTEAVLAAIQRMNEAFTRLLLSTLVDHAQLAEPERWSQSHEVVCAHAVNMRDDLEDSDWQVLYINGHHVDRTHGPLSVRDYTRQMIEQGWKTFSPPSSSLSAPARAPGNQSVYELYFYRPRSQDSTTS